MYDLNRVLDQVGSPAQFVTLNQITGLRNGAESHRKSQNEYEFELAGVAPETVHVSVEGSELVVTFKDRGGNERKLIEEIDQSLAPDSASAVLEHGMLNVLFSSDSRKVEIKVK